MVLGGELQRARWGRVQHDELAESPTGSGRRRIAINAAVVVAYVSLSVIVFWRVWSSHPTIDMQLGADQWRFVWFLAWVPHAITHGLNPFFSDYANVPVGVNLLSGGGAPLLGFVFAPVTWLCGPVATYNVVATSALALSATAGYAFVRRFTTWIPAAFAGGLLYGFSPAVIAKAAAGHIHLSFAPLPPLILLVVHELVIRQRSRRPERPGLLLGGLVAAQFLISAEILLDTALLAVAAVALAAIIGRNDVRARAKYATVGLIWAVGAGAVLLAFPLWFMYAGDAHVLGKLNLVPQAYRTNLLGPLLPNSNQLFAIPGFLTREADKFSTGVGENGSYLGIPLVALLVIAFIRLRRVNTVLVAGLLALGAFILSLGGRLAVVGYPRTMGDGRAAASIRLPETILEHLPVTDSVIPVRFALFVVLFSALILAFALEAIRAAASPSRRLWRFNLPNGWAARLAPLAVCSVVLLPLIPKVPFGNIASDSTPPFFSSGAVQAIPADSTALLFPFPSSRFPPPPLWQAETEFRFKFPGGGFLVPEGPGRKIAFSRKLGHTANSLTGRTLTDIAQGIPVDQTLELRDGLLEDLQAWQVRTVVAIMGYAKDPAMAEAFLTWLVGSPPVDLGGALVWRSIEGSP